MIGSIAGSSASEIPGRQKRAKGLDFRRHEIGEGPHSGGVLHVAVHEQVVGHYQSDIIDDTNKLTLVFPLKVRHRRKPGTGLHCKHQPLPMVASCCNRGMVCHRALPSRTWIIRDRAVAADNEMALQVLRIIRPTIPFHIGTAGIDRPGRISDLAADEGFVLGLAEADRDVGLPFGQIKNPVADYQLDPQTRIACMKGIDEWRPSETDPPGSIRRSGERCL